MLTDSFEQLWAALFTTPVNLDSALYKLSPKLSKEDKSKLAQVIHSLLLRPVTSAEIVGMRLKRGEPWSFTSKPEDFVNWSTAKSIAFKMLACSDLHQFQVFAKEEDFPPALLGEWRQIWGEEVKQQLVHHLGGSPPLSLRAKIGVGVKKLAQDLGGAKISKISPLGVYFPHYTPVLKTESFLKGDFEIQDEGSQILALFALWPEIFGKLLRSQPFSPQLKEMIDLPVRTPPWTVVDACAGAGGKTLALADALKGKGRVYAYDISEKKLDALKKRAQRGGYTNIQAVCIKSKEEETVQRFQETADVVLVDAPCSGWGVLRRNPDIKWRQTPDVLDRMPGIQSRLLSQYSKLVKPGGRLIFGVCTFRHKETQQVVENFIAENNKFHAEWGGYLGPGSCDGFFMQSMVREK